MILFCTRAIILNITESHCYRHNSNRFSRFCISWRVHKPPCRKTQPGGYGYPYLRKLLSKIRLL